MKLPRLRIHLLTALIIQIEVAVFVWANLHQRNYSDVEKVAGQDGVAAIRLDVNPVLTRNPLIGQGWPIFAYVHNSDEPFKLFGQPAEEWNFKGAIVDAFVAAIVLLLTYLLLERRAFPIQNPKSQK